MRRQIPGLNSSSEKSGDGLDGLFLVSVVRGFYRWDPRKPLVEVQFIVLEPRAHQGRSFSGRLFCTERALWKLHWFLKDFGYDADLLRRDQIDERALLNLRGVVRTSHKVTNGHSYQNLDSFAPEGEWETLCCGSANDAPEHQHLGGSDGL